MSNCFPTTILTLFISLAQPSTPFSSHPLLFTVVGRFVGTMSGADFCKLNRCLATRLTPLGFFLYPASGRTLQISPGKNDNLHLVTATSTAQGPGSIGLSLVLQSRPSVYGLICGFCSSARNFVHWRTFQPPQSGFLQIPPRDGHPCLRLKVPATESVVDFHHQVVAHAGRTKKPLSSADKSGFLV